MGDLPNLPYRKIVSVFLIIVILILMYSVVQLIYGISPIEPDSERLEGDIEISWNRHTKHITIYNRYNLEIMIRLYDKGGWSYYDPPDAILPVVNFTDDYGENAIEKDYTLFPQHSTIYRILLHERGGNHSKLYSADLFIHIGIYTLNGDKVTENSTTIRIYM